MTISTYPAASGGGIKSVQRGLASGSGNVTITAVDIAKSFVTVFGTTSSGTVAASGTVGTSTSTFPQTDTTPFVGSGAGLGNTIDNASKAIRIPATTINNSAANLSGGSNNLVSAVVQGYLSNSTTLVVSGACRWEVVEFN